MSNVFLTRGLVLIILSSVFVWGIFSRYDDEIRNDNNQRQKYLPYISGSLLPSCIFVILICGLLFLGIRETMDLLLSVCFNVFLHISVYYLILIAIIPFLRKYIRAKTCALLWLLPNFLYIMFYNFMKVEEPLVILHTPKKVVWILFIFWIIGFLAVFVGNIVSHYRLRTNILKNATNISDEEILEIRNSIIIM